jgi:carbon-monoxide dehydrogenase small subunit
LAGRWTSSPADPLKEVAEPVASSIVSFVLGDREVEVMVRPMATLQSVLRNQFGYTAAKEGCRQGGCGSCTVLVDDVPMAACLLPIEDVAGRRVTTLETLTPPEGLHPIQQAFLECNAYQCGYCTPGMVMLARALLDRDPAPTAGAIAEILSGNVCRCTGYRPIVEAIAAAAEAMRGSEATGATADDRGRPA